VRSFRARRSASRSFRARRSTARSFRARRSASRSFRAASLVEARLQGASLGFAQLQGASLVEARLQGALLDGAQLQGASLSFAQLQGALLKYAELQDASLNEAQLQGASFHRAQLQGAEFGKSTLAGTNISGAKVWRTSFEDASLAAVFDYGLEGSAISKGDFAALRATILKHAPNLLSKSSPRDRIAILNPDIFGPETSELEALEKGRVDETSYRSVLADQLKSLACSGDENAPYIVRGLIANERIKDTGAQAPGLVEGILNPDCPVSAALTEADKAAPKKIAKEAGGAH
jgi:hypothetical protein